ncbi:hypothetical protein SLEP1_g8005 [Rubroshorea leprosula]|uniref:Uncharacterized protein n=1 Tax=Rubroshorea leprosula TaxID=152421 RepID=A0AAV5I684_9ROSI|nr:hypothetical protein SLEP1_g8005 [Rubroshorea leprosula]
MPVTKTLIEKILLRRCREIQTSFKCLHCTEQWGSDNKYGISESKFCSFSLGSLLAMVPTIFSFPIYFSIFISKF